MAYMIETIKEHWYFDEGILEAMDDGSIRDIYEELIDWLEN